MKKEVERERKRESERKKERQRQREGEGEREREGGRAGEGQRTAGCWRMKTKIRNEMLLTFETGAATELQQNECIICYISTHNYIIYRKHICII